MTWESSIQGKRRETYLSNREMTAGILTWLQAQLSHGHQALDASAEIDKDPVLFRASDTAVRPLPHLKTLHQKAPLKS